MFQGPSAGFSAVTYKTETQQEAEKEQEVRSQPSEVTTAGSPIWYFMLFLTESTYIHKWLQHLLFNAHIWVNMQTIYRQTAVHVPLSPLCPAAGAWCPGCMCALISGTFSALLWSYFRSSVRFHHAGGAECYLLSRLSNPQGSLEDQNIQTAEDEEESSSVLSEGIGHSNILACANGCSLTSRQREQKPERSVLVTPTVQVLHRLIFSCRGTFLNVLSV